MIVAIDGPAGSGKSTVAKQVAQDLGFKYLDTGAMYRSVAYRALQEGMDLDSDAYVAIAQEEAIEFGNAGPRSVSIGGQDVTDAIRTKEVDLAVGRVSANPAVREALTAQQRAIAQREDIVMEGRDIGTVVFPDAEVKVFLTASAEERARRRSLQNRWRGVGETDEKAILTDIIRRDELDSSRDVAPLRAADDARALDTTGMSIDEVCETIERYVREARALR